MCCNLVGIEDEDVVLAGFAVGVECRVCLIAGELETHAMATSDELLANLNDMLLTF